MLYSIVFCFVVKNIADQENICHAGMLGMNGLSFDNVNPLTLRAAKRGLTIWKYSYYKHTFLETFEGGMLITSQTRTQFQIFCDFLLFKRYFQKYESSRQHLLEKL